MHQSPSSPRRREGRINSISLVLLILGISIVVFAVTPIFLHHSMDIQQSRNNNVPHNLIHQLQISKDLDTNNIPLQDFVYNYKMAISGNSEGAYQIKSEDPLKHLMIDSDSRDMLRSIEEDSEDYEGSMAEPLNNEECEATPQQEAWMVHAKSTCNYIHENDMHSDMRHQKTKLLGNGYWRDVWPVYDSNPSSLKAEKKVALKTIRW